MSEIDQEPKSANMLWQRSDSQIVDQVSDFAEKPKDVRISILSDAKDEKSKEDEEARQQPDSDNGTNLFSLASSLQK